MKLVEEISRFERARVIGARALQVALGAPALIETKSKDPLEIAEKEFEAGKIQMTVVRVLPGGEVQKVSIN